MRMSQKDAFVLWWATQQSYCVVSAALHVRTHTPTHTHIQLYSFLYTQNYAADMNISHLSHFHSVVWVSLFFSLSRTHTCTHTHTHTVADIHHTASCRKWGSCEQSGMTHCCPCTSSISWCSNSQQFTTGESNLVWALLHTRTRFCFIYFCISIFSCRFLLRTIWLFPLLPLILFKQVRRHLQTTHWNYSTLLTLFFSVTAYCLEITYLKAI